jgi:hypothetical protein
MHVEGQRRSEREFDRPMANSAHASCGDYVLTGPFAQSEVQPDARHRTLTHEPNRAIRPELPVPHPPCQGPGCRRQTPAVPTAPITIEPVMREWGTLSRIDVLTIRVVQWIDIEPVLALSDTMSMRIERPPRSIFA